MARERLCLRATADYWVNAMDGQPFFVVSQAVDPGLLQVSVETTQIYLEATLAMKEQALAKTTPPHGSPGRFRPSDRLLSFLNSL